MATVCISHLHMAFGGPYCCSKLLLHNSFQDHWPYTNPISVLATLFLLSYIKLLRTIITTFSFTTLDYPKDRTVAVWVYDGNIGYLEGKHIPLFLAGLLAFLFLFLPFTLLLLFGQCIVSGSNHRLLTWVNKPKVRSLLDAYHGPYKNHHRYWTGMLLLLCFALFISSAVVDLNSPKDPIVILLVLGTMCICLAIWVCNSGWYHCIPPICKQSKTGGRNSLGMRLHVNGIVWYGMQTCFIMCCRMKIAWLCSMNGKVWHNCM